MPPVQNVEIPLPPALDGHTTILKNFIEAINKNAPLIAPAHEGIRSVELSNAMLLSGLTEQTIKLPIDGKEYERFLLELIRKSERNGL